MILMFSVRIAGAQEVRFRTFSDVLLEIYHRYDDKRINAKIPADLLREDIDLFVRTIEEIGVDPYINLSKDEFYNKIKALKDGIDRPLTRREIMLRFAPVVNDLRLSHTYPFIPWKLFEEKAAYDKANGKYLPLEIRIEDSRLRIAASHPSAHIPAGEEIIAVNDVDSKALIENLYRYAAGATRIAKLMDIQESFAVQLWWVYDFTGPFIIKTKASVYTVEGLTAVERDNWRSKSHNPEAIKKNIQYEYQQLDSTTGLLNVRDFTITDEAEYFGFIDSAFLLMRKQSIKNLIIDVRDNPGGGDDYGIEIVKYLSPLPFKAFSRFYYKKSRRMEDFSYLFLYPEDRNNPKMRKAANCLGDCQEEHEFGTSYECGNKALEPKPDSIRFRGNVFVLSNYKVYSAANTFVGLIKDYHLGKIIGTETGQSMSNDGQQCWFFLPHMNVMAGGSTTLCIRPNGDPGTARGILPDYEVVQSEGDSKKGVDTVMDFALKLIDAKPSPTMRMNWGLGRAGQAGNRVDPDPSRPIVVY
jgi:C-terminal processing protease CtpA/Prc